MNIVVKPYGSDLCYCRPDTTWERENRDFYSPECVNEVHWAPIVFARVSKAGKCIGRKFAQRYYDGIGCGMLMYCNVELNENSNMPAISANVDHTSILPMPLYNPAVLEEPKVFEVIRNSDSLVTLTSNGAHITSTEQSQWTDILEEALCNASALTSLRIGDFIAVELAPSTSLATRQDAEVSVKGTFCENEIFNFRLHL